ncbi:hypothetical protein OAF16_03565 [Flavobacteriales bacterium]|nr:hypothetical protein [Flavobacteriales bacterium]
MVDFFDSFFGKTLRWISFIPLAFLAMVISKFLISFLRYDEWSEYLIAIIPTCIAVNAFSYFAFVFTIFHVVPSYKKTITTIISSILLLGLLISNLLVFSETPFLPKSSDTYEISILSVISSFLGGVYALYAILSKE